MLLHHSRVKVPTAPHSQLQEQGASPKPNGFWVSVAGDRDWYDFCHEEGYRTNCFKHTLEVSLVKDANILYLYDEAVMDTFHDTYCARVNANYSSYINWRKVAKAFDGIIIPEYIYSRRLDGNASDWYYGWDCASGCIWDARAIKTTKKITKPKWLKLRKGTEI